MIRLRGVASLIRSRWDEADLTLGSAQDYKLGMAEYREDAVGRKQVEDPGTVELDTICPNVSPFHTMRSSVGTGIRAR